MATLVKFYVEPENADILAVFPQKNVNARIYGNYRKVAYSSIDGTTCCHIDYLKDSCRVANNSQYAKLLATMESIGYTDLKVLNKC